MSRRTSFFRNWDRHHGIIALALVCVAVFIVWANWAEIEEVSHAQGQVIARSRTQVIQSANDGVIEALLVHEGDKVSKGQVLVRLEREQAEAAHSDSRGKVAAIKANLSRLRAEVFGRPLAFPLDVQAYPAFVANQTELFQRRRKAVDQEVGALQANLRLVREELGLNQPLLASGDISKSDIIRLQRQVAELQGAITNRQNKYFQDAQADMTKAEEDLSTQEQILADRSTVLDRTEVRAPADALVRKIYLTTPGAKVKPGDVVMELLPTDSTLVVEAKLRPADIAFVRVGLPAAVKLDAYDYSIYGTLHGKVSYISPDALSEESRAGEQIYYRVHIVIDESELVKENASRDGKKKIEIQPGMTASVDIRTGSRTVLHYLSKPISKTFAESLGER